MATRTLTSANCIYILYITGLYPSGVQLQGFSADAAFETEATDVAETMKGVDNKMSAGWIPSIKPQTITLQADSLSNDVFDFWNASEGSIREKIKATATINMAATQKEYRLRDGYLKRTVRIPAARKILQPRAFVIDWGEIAYRPLS